MNRGRLQRVRNPVLGNLASMRPRFMNRGRPEERPAQNAQDAASMRPRFMNRGRTSGMAVTPTQNRFNEAPIHESGKERGCVRADREGLASMRPRFMNRGRSPKPRPKTKPAPCFNEAPIHESGKRASDYIRRPANALQ